MVTFASVARKIGNPRLEKVLAQRAVDIETEVHNTKFIRKPSDVRNSFNVLKSEAQRFEKALSNISMLDVPAYAIERLPVARKAVREVSTLCDEALSDTSVKRGAPKKPGRVTCALIVIEAWAFAHGRLPGANNPKTQEACEEYWRASGGPPIGKEGDPSNWRKTVKPLTMTATLNGVWPLIGY
jgi:hypothetical protein